MSQLTDLLLIGMIDFHSVNRFSLASNALAILLKIVVFIEFHVYKLCY